MVDCSLIRRLPCGTVSSSASETSLHAMPPRSDRGDAASIRSLSVRSMDETSLSHQGPVIKGPPPAPTKQNFTVKHPYIYATTASGSAQPVFHLSLLNTNEGKPFQLRICRLLPSEARRLSRPHQDGDMPSFVRYDEDLTLYVAQKVTAPFSLAGTQVCIRGCKRRTVSGTVVMEKVGGMNKGFKFLHVTAVKKGKSEAELEKQQKLMNKRGYRPSDDWKQELLFFAKITGSGSTLEWSDADKRPIATETDDGFVTTGDLDAEAKDLLISCWLSKAWILEKMLGAESTPTFVPYSAMADNL